MRSSSTRRESLERNRLRLLILGTTIMVAASGASAQEPQYQVIDLGKSEWGIASAEGLNDIGDAVGYVDVGTEFGGPRHAFAWIDGQAIDLTDDDGVDLAYARDISNRRFIVGEIARSSSLPDGGFRWWSNGFETLPSRIPGQQSAGGVDERGFVFGRAHNASFGLEPTVWNRSLQYDGLGSFGYDIGFAYEANGWSQIVGYAGVDFNSNTYHAFCWENGVLRDLGALQSHDSSIAFGINNHGHIVGRSGAALSERAFMWTAADGMIDLSDLGFSPRASADDINDHGEIVGYSYREDGRVGVVWIDGEIYDLNALIDPADGWRIGWASAINNAGQIAANARIGNDSHAILLSPIDVPHLTAIGPIPGRIDQLNRVDVLHATPGARVAVVVGVQRGEHAVPGCGDLSVDLADPVVFGTRADADGIATIEMKIAARLRGQRVLVQAVDFSSCRVSNLVVQKIDPASF